MINILLLIENIFNVNITMENVQHTITVIALLFGTMIGLMISNIIIFVIKNGIPSRVTHKLMPIFAWINKYNMQLKEKYMSDDELYEICRLDTRAKRQRLGDELYKISKSNTRGHSNEELTKLGLARNADLTEAKLFRLLNINLG
jgi:hypothetical protein